jgi:hypothetical protein
LAGILPPDDCVCAKDTIDNVTSLSCYTGWKPVPLIESDAKRSMPDVALAKCAGCLRLTADSGEHNQGKCVR